MPIVNMLIITAVVCFIVDLSGIVDTIKHFLWKKYINAGDYHNLALKPLDCSLCMTWWSCLLYIILSGHFTIPYIGLCAGLALISSNVSDLLRYVKDFFVWITNLLYKIIE